MAVEVGLCLGPLPSSRKKIREFFQTMKCIFFISPLIDIFHPLLSPERAPLGKSRLSSGWLAENGRARGADDDSLCVGEDGGDAEASWALHVHEE